MPPIQAVIFDLDDTLYREKDYTFSGYRAVATEFASALGDPDQTYHRLCELFDSPKRARVFDAILEQSGTEASTDIVLRMVEAFRAHVPSIQLYDDADTALASVRNDYKLGIISDGFLIAQQNKINALHLSKRVDEVILTDALGREFWKPHPRAFEEIAERLGVDHAGCVYIADNLAKDFVAPNALGWHTIHVDRPGAVHRENKPPKGADPQHAITRLDQLTALLSKVS